MIPQFDAQGSLPLGLHDTSIEEIRSALGFTPKRTELIDGLENFLNIWNASGFLDHSIIDGSFVTSKREPRDIDMILVLKENAAFSSALKDLLRSHSYDREFTKREFGCEAFLVTGQADLEGWVDFFGHDRQGRVRGLLRLGFPL